MIHPPRDTAREIVAELELIPGHPATAAEVWVWHGSVPEVSKQHLPWVVLQGDDWPMSPHVARRLAAALLRGADRAEAAGHTSGDAVSRGAGDSTGSPVPGASTLLAGTIGNALDGPTPAATSVTPSPQ